MDCRTRLAMSTPTHGSKPARGSLREEPYLGRAEFFALPALVARNEVQYSARPCTAASESLPLFHRVSWLF